MSRYFNEQQKVHIYWRQEGRCGDCGEKVESDYQFHHILNWKDSGETSIDNGVLLCYDCHKSIHDNGKFSKSIIISHNDIRYANFVNNGESIYIKTRLEIENEINKLRDKDLSDNFFQEHKQTAEQLKNTIDKFKNLFLIREDKNMLFERANYIRDFIHKKVELKIKDNYAKAYNLACEAYNYALALNDFKEANQTIIEYQNNAKKYMLPKKEREEIQKKFQDTWTILNTRRKKSQEEYKEKTEKNFNIYWNKLETLKSNIADTINFQLLREELKSIQFDMKNVKLRKEDLNKLFTLSHNLFENINEKQKQSKLEYEYECINNKAIIVEDLNDFIVVESSNFREKREFLKNIQAKMKSKKFKKEDREYLFGWISQCFEEIQDCQNTVYEQKQQEYERKQEEWKTRLRENIENIEKSISNLEDSIDYDKNKLSEKEYKLYNVSDKWRESLEDSIRILQEKIDSKENKLQSMKSKLNDMENKL